MQKFAIIVAGGSGSRMNSPIPKQFIEINKKPLLDYTIEAFLHADASIKIIVVLPKQHVNHWKKITTTKNYSILEGGNSRYHSVKNGLNHITGLGLVAIHDGARPLVSAKIISEGFTLLSTCDSCVPSIDLKNSIRKIHQNTNQSVDRSKYKIVQTPQFFNANIIKKAYAAIPFSKEITDDASVAEQNGQAIKLFEGDENNIKVTTPMDLKLAEALLLNKLM